MSRSQHRGRTTAAVIAATLVGLTVCADVTTGQSRGTPAPAYRVVPLWPQPFFDDSWILGSVTGVAVDATNHIWVTHRGADSLQTNEKGMIVTPPASSVCCQPAPPVLEFDAAGRLVSSFGGVSAGYQWPQVAGGIAVDSKGNVWIAATGLEPALPAGGGRGGRGGTAAPAAGSPAPQAPAASAGPGVTPDASRGAGTPAGGRAGGGGARGGAAAPAPPVGPADAHVLKFSRNGRYQLTIGTPGKMDGPDSQTTLNRPAAVAYDPAANEVFVADSGNHRVIVFDADSGVYKRHWFAYGEKAAGPGAGPYDPNAVPSRSFRDVTCVEIARDGMVYVCDRTSNRLQVFDKSGKFVREKVIAKDTGGASVGIGAGATAVTSVRGSVWDVAFSNDPQQRYVFVADGVNKKVRTLERSTLEEVGSFGAGGRYPGQFVAVGSIAADAQGNVYTGETHHGKRVQKFVPVR